MAPSLLRGSAELLRGVTIDQRACVLRSSCPCHGSQDGKPIEAILAVFVRDVVRNLPEGPPSSAIRGVQLPVREAVEGCPKPVRESRQLGNPGKALGGTGVETNLEPPDRVSGSRRESRSSLAPQRGCGHEMSLLC